VARWHTCIVASDRDMHEAWMGPFSQSHEEIDRANLPSSLRDEPP
jgi:hypothetical protein